MSPKDRMGKSPSTDQALRCSFDEFHSSDRAPCLAPFLGNISYRRSPMRQGECNPPSPRPTLLPLNVGVIRKLWKAHP